MKLHQKGFGIIEGLLIVIVVLILGFAGYYVLTQSDDDESNEVSSVEERDETENSISEAITIDEILEKLDTKVTDISEGLYKVEKLDGSATEIQIDEDSSVQVTDGNSIFYRTEGINPGDQYTEAILQDGTELREYLVNTLDLQPIYVSESSTPSGLTFKRSVYKINDSYLELATSQMSFVISWTE